MSAASASSGVSWSINRLFDDTEVLGDSIPSGRSSTAIGIINDKLYVFSGENAPRVPTDNSLYVFDLNKHTWQKLPALIPSPIARVGHAGCVCDGVLYIYGGRTAYDATKTLNDLWAFTPDDSLNGGSWKEITKKAESDVWPEPLSYHAMAASPTSLFLFGGCFPVDRSNLLYSFTPSTHAWSLLSSATTPNAPTARGGPTVTYSPSMNALFAGFGYNGKNELDDLYMFSLEKNEWSEVKGTNAPAARSVTDVVHVSGVGEKGCLLVYGGEYTPSKQGHEGAGEFHNDVHVYDIASRQWSRVAENEGKAAGLVARGWFNTVERPGKGVVFFGGFDGVKRMNDVWQIGYTH